MRDRSRWKTSAALHPDPNHRWLDADFVGIARTMGQLAATPAQDRAVVAFCSIPTERHRREFFALVESGT